MSSHQLSQQMLDGFRAVVRSSDRTSWNIIGAAFDPDWLATSLLVQRILDCHGQSANLVCGRRSGHAQSVMLWNLYGLHDSVLSVSDMDADLPSALLDSSEMEDARFGEEMVIDDPLIVIDHHEGSIGVANEAFYYVAKTGACTTLALNLAMSLGVPIDQRTATAAAIGIFTDTEELFPGIATTFDLEMYDWAMSQADTKLYSAVANRKFTAPQQLLLKQIYAQCESMHGALVAHADRDLSSGEGEMLGEAARFLAKQGETRLALVWGIEEAKLRVSVRSQDPSVPIETLLRGMFGPYCGARACVGGATVPLDPSVRAMDPTRRTQEITSLIRLHLAVVLS